MEGTLYSCSGWAELFFRVNMVKRLSSSCKRKVVLMKGIRLKFEVKITV